MIPRSSKEEVSLGMIDDSGRDLPVWDDGARQDLAEDAGEAVARAFVEEYLLMLLARVAKIFRAFTHGDLEESLDALVSLRTSSEMAGAPRLASYCWGLEAELKQGQGPAAAAMQAALSSHIRDVIREASRRGYFPLKRDAPGA
jgi:HPt (histidine-containing phosphotransfer) domain-containing protein